MEPKALEMVRRTVQAVVGRAEGLGRAVLGRTADLGVGLTAGSETCVLKRTTQAVLVALCCSFPIARREVM